MDKAERKKKKITLVIVLTVVLLGGVAAAISSDRGRGSTSELEIPVRSKGAETAVVVIEEYADYGCITCRVWHQMGIVDQILEEYDGLVRFDWYDFPIITANSPKAAEAGFCAFDQGMFWEYHDVVFENYPLISEENLKQYAFAIGLDSQEFIRCLDSDKYQEVVKEEIKAAHRLGLRSTPSFRVNGNILIGLPTFDVLAAAIDEILVEKEN